MTRTQKIQELKEELQSSDYKVVKNAELLAKGLNAEYDVNALHEERQAIRDEINRIMGMTDEEYMHEFDNIPQPEE